MKIKGKDVISQSLPGGDLQHKKIHDDYEQNNEMGPSKSKLEADYISSGLEYGDRLRVVDREGKLFDVIWMPDGTVGVQELKLKIEYGTTHKYTEWGDAEKVVGDYSIEKRIQANKKIIALIKKVFGANNNPYS
jgi:hypothetical protein